MECPPKLHRKWRERPNRKREWPKRENVLFFLSKGMLGVPVVNCISLTSPCPYLSLVLKVFRGWTWKLA